MKSLGYHAAFASLLSAGTAHAQNASSAFQCGLPYEDSMMALGSLDLKQRTAIAPFPGLHGDGERIEFSTAGTHVFSASPKSMTLEVLEPHPLQPKKKFVVTLASTFDRTTATDELIQKAVKWHIQCGALGFCIRSSESTPDGAGRLEYSRKDQLTLECIFEFTPEEFDAIGE